MLGFGLGVVIGFFAGIIVTLILLILIQAIPDGDVTNPSKGKPWQGMGVVAGLLIASGIISALLDLQRVAFATTAMLLVVFVVAHLRGMLVSWIALAVAALSLCLALPPVGHLTIAEPQDQILIVFFMLCGVIGTRLIAQPEKV
jgi:K+-sensing histidine kinase KdpD